MISDCDCCIKVFFYLLKNSWINWNEKKIKVFIMVNMYRDVLKVDILYTP